MKGLMLENHLEQGLASQLKALISFSALFAHILVLGGKNSEQD